MPQRISWHRFLGVPLPENTVDVTRRRGSPWGNPFVLAPKGPFAREQALWLFDQFARWRTRGEPAWLEPLRGKDLACSCRLDQVCHADLLLELAHGNSGTIVNMGGKPDADTSRGATVHHP